MKRNLTFCTLFLLLLAAAAFAAPPAPQTLPLPLPTLTADGSSGCPPADLLTGPAQLSAPAPQAPGDLPELFPTPEPRTASCDPVRCSKLHGVCECDQLGNCFCVPI